MTPAARNGNDKPPLFDLTEVRKAMDVFLPAGAVTEVRILDATTADDRRPHTESGYLSSPDALVASLESRGLKTFRGAYFTPNRCNPALLARAENRLRAAGPKSPTTGDSDILRREWLLVDVDPQRPADISSSDEEHEAAIQLAREIRTELMGWGWPAPVACDSGNGAHLLWKISETPNDDGLISRCLVALGERFDTDIVKLDRKVFNPARIWKLYGTRSAKGDDVTSRPWRMSRLLHVPENIEAVNADQLRKLAAEAPIPEPRQRAPYSNNGQAPYDVEGFIERNSLAANGPNPWNGTGRMWTFTTSPMCDHHDRAAFICQHPSGAVTAQCHHNSCSWNWADLRGRLEPRELRSGSIEGKVKTELPTAKCEQLPTATRSFAITTAPHFTGRRELKPFVPFPIELLPQPICELAVSASEASGYDATAIVFPALTACAALIGNSRELIVNEGMRWFEPCILWTAIIAESGYQKSVGPRIALRPIAMMESNFAAEYESECGEGESEQKVYEHELMRWKRSPGAGPPPEAPLRPVMKRITIRDATREAVSARLSDNPRGLLSYNDELASWFGGHDRYSGSRGKLSGDIGFWLSAYSAEPVTVDRKSGPAVFIPRAALCVGGTIQPDILQCALGSEHVENGLASRFWFAAPPCGKRNWDARGIDVDVESAYEATARALYALQMSTDTSGRPCPRRLRLSQQAVGLFQSYVDELENETAGMGGALKYTWRKLPAGLARLSMIIHLIRAVSFLDTPSDKTEVDLKSMQSAIGIVDWLKNEAERVYDIVLQESNDDRRVREMVDWIAGQGGRTTPSHMSRCLRRFRGKGGADRAESELNELRRLSLGRFELTRTSTTGPEAREFVLNDTGPAAAPLRSTEVLPAPEFGNGNAHFVGDPADEFAGVSAKGNGEDEWQRF